MAYGTTFNPYTMISVKAEGAVGDGVANDAIAIQKAEDASAASGKTVFFEPGTYLIDVPIDLLSNTTLVTSALGATLISADDATSIFTDADAGSVSNVTICGITLDSGSGRANSASPAPLVSLGKANHITLNSDTFNVNSRAAVILIDSSYSGLLDCTVLATGGAPHQVGQNAPPSGAIEFLATTPQSITNSDASSIYNFIIDSTIVSSTNAVVVEGQAAFDLVENTLSSQTSQTGPGQAASVGVYLANVMPTTLIAADASGVTQRTPLSGSMISGNLITDFAGGDLSLASSSSIDVINNTFKANSSVVIVASEVSDVSISQNHVLTVVDPASASATISALLFTGAKSENVDISSNSFSFSGGSAAPVRVLASGAATDLSGFTFELNNKISGATATSGVLSNIPSGVGSSWRTAFTIGIAPSVSVTASGDATSAAFSGTADPFSTITLSENGSAFASTTSTSDGSFAITVPGLSAGQHNLIATEVEQSGQVQPAVHLALTLQPLTTPLTAGLKPGSISYFDNSKSISGTAPSGTSVSITVGNQVLATVIAGPTGSWSYGLSSPKAGEVVTVSNTTAGQTTSLNLTVTPTVWLTANQLTTGGFTWLPIPVSTNGVTATAAAADFISLVNPDEIAQWEQVANDTKVFKMYSEDLSLLTDAQLHQIATFINATGYQLVMEGLETLDSDPNSYAVSAYTYDRIKGAGLTLDAVALDEPLGIMGPNLVASLHAQTPAASKSSIDAQAVKAIANDAKTALNLAQSYFPNVKFGYIESTNTLTGDAASLDNVSNIILFADTFRQVSGQQFAFFQADGAYGPVANWQPLLDSLSVALQNEGIPLDVLVAEFGRDSIEVVDTDLKNTINLYLDHKIKFSSINFQSWGAFPKQLLSETTAGTLTNAALNYVDLDKVSAAYEATLHRSATFYELFSYSKMLSDGTLAASDLDASIAAGRSVAISVSMEDTYLTQDWSLDTSTQLAGAVGVTFSTWSTSGQTFVEVLSSTTPAFSVADTAQNTTVILDVPATLKLGPATSNSVEVKNFGSNQIILGAVGQRVTATAGKVMIDADAAYLTAGTEIVADTKTSNTQLNITGGGNVVLGTNEIGISDVLLNNGWTSIVEPLNFNLSLSSSQSDIIVHVRGADPAQGLWTGVDTIKLSTNTQEVSVEPQYGGSLIGGSIVVSATAAEASAAVLGAAGISTTINITTAGEINLNPQTKNVVIDLAPVTDPKAATTLALNDNAKITVQSDRAAQINITLGQVGQRITDLAGDLLVTADAKYLTVATSISGGGLFGHHAELSVLGGGKVALGPNDIGLTEVSLTNGGGPSPRSDNYNLILSAAQDGITVKVLGAAQGSSPWQGTDTITLADASQTVLVETDKFGNPSSGVVLVKATTSAAAASVHGNTQTKTTLEITNQGTATLNPESNNLIVKLDYNDLLITNQASFITVDASFGHSNVEMHGSGQTIIAGQGGSLTDASGGGASLVGTSTSLFGNTFNWMNALDSIDITDFDFSKTSLAQTAAFGIEHLVLSNGTTKFTINVTQSDPTANFTMVSDGHVGTLLKLG